MTIKDNALFTEKTLLGFFLARIAGDSGESIATIVNSVLSEASVHYLEDSVWSIETSNEDNAKIHHMEIDTRRPQWAFQPVDEEEILDALNIDHKDDFSKDVKHMARFNKKLLGLFTLDCDEYYRYVGKSVCI